MVVYWVDIRKVYKGENYHGNGTFKRPFDNPDLVLAAVENSSFPSEVVPSSSSFGRGLPRIMQLILKRQERG